jgi:hypothetical protein
MPLRLARVCTSSDNEDAFFVYEEGISLSNVLAYHFETFPIQKEKRNTLP